MRNSHILLCSWVSFGSFRTSHLVSLAFVDEPDINVPIKFLVFDETKTKVSGAENYESVSIGSNGIETTSN